MFRTKTVLLFFLFCLAVSPASVFADNNLSEKPIAAVLDIIAEDISESEARAITNLLISALHGTDLVQIIDRNQREEILNEISFSLSGCADDSCALEIGKMLAADLLITGSLARVGSRVSIELKALNVEEGSIIETTFKLYDSIDEVVNNIDSVGATLLQNITGKRAAQREVLEYEDLVTLTIVSDTEEASVIINGAPVGRIKGGQLTKALNRNIDVVIEMESANYYPLMKEIYLDEDFSIEMNMEPHYPVESAFRFGTGGGSMAFFNFRTYFEPAVWFLDFGLGGVLQPTNEFFLKTSACFDTGVYFATENNFLRPWGGFALMLPFISYMQPVSGPARVDLLVFDLNNRTNEYMDSDSWLKNIDFGPVFGIDFCLTENIYLGVDAKILLNKAFQLSDGIEYNLLDMLFAPFLEMANVVGYDPIIQFGVNTVIHLSPPIKSNHPDSVRIEGNMIKWEKREYLPELFTGHSAFISELEAEKDLSEEVKLVIKDYYDVNTALWISAGATALSEIVFFGLIAADSGPNFENPPTVFSTAGFLISFTANIASFIALGVTEMPLEVINSYNKGLGGAK